MEGELKVFRKLIVSTLLLTSCMNPEIHDPEGLTILPDLSRSSDIFEFNEAGVLVRNENAIAKLKARAAAEVDLLNYRDRISLYPIGDAVISNQIPAFEAILGIDHSYIETKAALDAEIDKLIDEHAENGGDDYSNIILALNDAKPLCANRGIVQMHGDGVENGRDYKVPKAMRSGQKISLPQPETPFLKNCIIKWYRFAQVREHPVTGKLETLNLKERQALEHAWREYFVAAGVNPNDIHFL